MHCGGTLASFPGRQYESQGLDALPVPARVAHYWRKMTDDSLTLVLDGTVTLADLAQAVGDFEKLVSALSTEVAIGEIEWVVTALEGGSATATVAGRGVASEVEKVVRAYEEVGSALQFESPFPYSARVRDPAVNLTRQIGSRIESIRFETARTDSLVRQALTKTPPLAPQPRIEVAIPPALGNRQAYGIVDGIVETLSHRLGLRFVLYDSIFDKSVSCYLVPGYEEIMRDVWGRTARVYGNVRRDQRTGRPLSVREVTKVQRVEPGTPGAWRLARGAAPALTDETPETAIRALRDA